MATGIEHPPSPIAQGVDTLYRQVEQAIFQEIREGRLRPGDHLGNARALGRQWNVSPSTIRQAMQMLASRGVVTRRPRVGTVVSDKAFEIVNRGAQPRASRPTSAPFALIVPDLRWPEYSSLLRGCTDGCEAYDRRLTVFNTDDVEERYTQFISAAIRDQAPGIVIVPPFTIPLPWSCVAELHQSGIPLVTCYRPIPALGCPLVSGVAMRDGMMSSQEAVMHLAEIGCRRLGLLRIEAPPFWNQLPTDVVGFERGLLDAGIPGEHAAIYDLPYQIMYGERFAPDKPQAIKRITEWLEQTPNIDGIIAVNDIVACLAISAVLALGKRIPEDVCIIGSGGLPPYVAGGSLRPTTFETIGGSEAIGRRAIDILHRLVSGEHLPRDHVETIGHQMVLGETTRPKPQTQTP